MNSFLVWALSFTIIIAIVRFNFNLTPSLLLLLLFGSVFIAFWIIKMKFHHRRFGGSCLNNPKVEDNSDANNPVPIPPHLVIMVNGIVGR